MGGTNNHWTFGILLLVTTIHAIYSFRRVMALNPSVCRPHYGSYLDGVHASSGKPYYLSILSIFKNERRYLPEWLEYHLLAGVQHFFLIDHNSSDAPREILVHYIQADIVTYILKQAAISVRRNVHLEVYNQGLHNFSSWTFWLAFIDIDEFIVSVSGASLRQCLAEFQNESALGIHWVFYGHSGQDKRQSGLVMERFRCHAHPSDSMSGFTKAIVRPERVRGMNVHYPCMQSGFTFVNIRRKRVDFSRPCHEKIIINHYCFKSREEFCEKQSRGYPQVRALIPWDLFYNPNYSAVTNATIMLPYIPIVKKNIQGRFGIPVSDQRFWS